MKTSQQLIAEARAVINEVSIDELTAAFKQHPDVILIDVREAAEFDQGHIHGAVNFPRGTLEMQIHSHPTVAASFCDPLAALQQLALQPVYLICRTGGRSALAAVSLQTMGFTQVYSVAGGMQAWQQQKGATYG